MKTSNIYITAIILLSVLSQSCTKESARIEGSGTITTETLSIQEFSGIAMEGADNVFINYGPKQKVEVTGHPNIISRIKTEVNNGTWDMGLERGTYGNYELTYKLTLPGISEVRNIGSGNVQFFDPMEESNLELSILGSGSISAFPLRAENCQVDITGSGNCEITATTSLDVSIDGSGSVFYKGSPSINDHITGSGRVTNAN